ncbi:MAG: CHAT domain-containing tetratricopeptide repeat protein [Cyanobacteria bacterium P01_H01_bin.58]
MPLAKSSLTLFLSIGLLMGALPASFPAQAQQETDPAVEATELLRQGQAQFAEGNWVEAIASLEAALSLYQQLGQPDFSQITAMTLWQVYEGYGNALMQVGAWEDAFNTYQQQRDLAEQLQDPTLQANSQLNLGSAALQAERWETARDALLAGLELAEVATMPLLQQRGLALLLVVETSLGNLEGTITAAEALLIITDNPVLQFQAAQGLGSAYFYQGDYDRAWQYHQQTRKLAAAIGDPYFQAIALANLGETRLAQADGAAAIALLSDSLAIAETVDPLLAGVVQGTLGNAYGVAGDFGRALPLLAARVEQEAADGSPSGQAIALTNLGNARFLAGDIAGATTALQQAATFWANQRSEVATPTLAISRFDQQLMTYRTLQQVLITAGNPEAALVAAEQGRSQVLAQQLATNAPGDTPAIGLAALQQVARTQNATLVEYSLIPDNREIFIPNRVNNRWLNTATELYIWVIKPDGTVDFESVSLDEGDRDLAATILQTREAIGARGRAGAAPVLREPQPLVDLDAQLQQLHRLLIEPIAEHLPDNPEAPVVFVPQESLLLVPFAALQDDAGQYLIERHTLLTVPSIHSLQFIQTEAANRSAGVDLSDLTADETVIVGNPTMPTLAETPLSPLPGAEQEAISIAEQLNAVPLLGADATEATVRDRLANARLIHLATHGLLDYGDPAEEIPGAIALATDAQHDGLLTATEIAQQPLVADLVVLSACDTGQGSITGDGMVGLSRSLLVAGVPRVVVSLWAVPDMPTAALMTAFYEQLEAGQDTAQALRQAMLTTMENHPDPKDWAAFTLIGASE